MIAAENLAQPPVHAFVSALNALDDLDREPLNHVVRPDFWCTSGQSRGGLENLLTNRIRFAATAQSDDGLTLTGFAALHEHSFPSTWVFTVKGNEVQSLEISIEAKPTPDQQQDGREAFEELDRQITAAKYERATDQDGRTHLPGTARRRKIGAVPYLHAWKPGALGAISWINTGVRLEDPDVYKSFASPESGDSVRKSASSRVDFRLSLPLGWDGDDYQKAVVTLDATSYYKDGTSWPDFGTWIKEKHSLVDRTVPRVTGTLTLTGPDGAVISTEEIKAKGVKPPYPMSFTREYALADLPPGPYTVALTGAVKTGGFQFSGDDSTVDMDDRSITFDVGT
ncbi:hypothetical protein [Streptomyces sp. NPDC059802]|uniref:hypothetical protein n=1 Tax=Streptomyces sp. NPDC059802 TaxID=3346952 RepID=UPI003656644D